MVCRRTCYTPGTMSKRTTYFRLSAIRIATALAVAGIGVLFVGAAPSPTPVPTITVEAQVDDPFPSSGDAVTLTDLDYGDEQYGEILWERIQ